MQMSFTFTSGLALGLPLGSVLLRISTWLSKKADRRRGVQGSLTQLRSASRAAERNRAQQ